jgi:hypothetical protein
MTAPGWPDPPDGNPSPEPVPVYNPPEWPDRSVGAQSGVGGVNPLTQPELFVRPPRRRPRRRLFGILSSTAVLVVAALFCAGLVKTLAGDKRTPSSAAAASSAPALRSPASTSSPAVAPSPPAIATSPSALAPSATGKPLDAVQVRDCLKNNGTDSAPDMVPVACTRGTYQVLRRLFGTIDPSPCRSVRGTTSYYTVTYYRNAIPDVGLSYVFCLKKL